MAHPKGWHPGQTDTRFANVAPRSLDLKSRSVEAVISRGADVQRVYGTERLRISPDAVVVDRLARSGIPLLDSHQQGGLANMLGTIQRVWFDAGALMGKLSFNQTPQGEMAMGMVERGEVVGISAGYKVLSWEV